MESEQRPGSRSLFRTLRWLIPLLIIVGAIVFRLVALGTVKAASEATPVPVRTMRPVRGDLVKSLRLNAHVESETMVTVLPLVSGVLQELKVDVGQTVRKNEVIARIDAQRFELQLQQAQAAYLSAKSSYDRVSQMYKANATTQQNYEQARSQYEAYQSQYELARIQLDYASVKSPVDGVVLVKHLSAGSIAAPERPIVTIGDLNDLVVRARVPERYYEGFTAKRDTMLITITRPGGGEYRGAIRSISPFVSAETKNFEVVVSIGGKPEALRPGMFIGLEFELVRWPDVYSLPFEALGGGDTVWHVENGLAVKETYKPVNSTDAAFEVPAAWADRDIIIEGQYFARDGGPVSVIKAEGSGS